MKRYNQKVYKYFLIWIISLIFLSGEVSALNYFWVGNSGNWSDYSVHWSTTSGGGTFHTQVPTSNDNVYFDANSFSAAAQTVNMDQTIVYCGDMSWTGVTNSPTLAGSTNNKLDIFGSLTLVSAMNLTFAGDINFSSNSAGNTISSASNIFLDDIYFDGVGGEWAFQDMMSFATNIGVYLDAGTLSTNNQTINFGKFWSTSAATTVFNLGSSVINLQGTVASWYSTGSGLTINPGTSTINIEGEGSFNFYGGGKTYYDVNLKAGTNNVSYNNSYNNLNILMGSMVVLTSGYTQTIGGTLSAIGDCNNEIIIKTSSPGSSSSISKSAGSVVTDFISLTDVAALGGASFTANNAIDGGGNSGWTINTRASQNFYWIGNSGNWTDFNNWSLTSGGAPGTCLPSSIDDVFFDANSFSGGGQTVNLDNTAPTCRSMTWTGATNSPTLGGAASNELHIFGSLTLIAGMNLTFTGDIYFSSISTGRTITTANNTILSPVYVDGNGGEWTLQDDLTFSTNKGIDFEAGTFNTNGQTVNFGKLWSTGALGRVLNFSTSIINLQGTSVSWYTTASGLTINPGTSTVNIIGEGAFNFYGGGKTYYDVTFQANTTNVDYSNSYNNLTLTKGTIVSIDDGEIQTIAGNLIANGDCADAITIKTTVPGVSSTFSKSSGSVILDYVSLTDIAAVGGASFTANNAIDGGGNSGWTINLGTSKDFYWIGNNGNWSSFNSWSLSSGGPVAGCLPSAIDDVYFDVNSFNGGGQIATVDITTATCRSMNWAGATNTPTLGGTSGNELHVFGSLTLIAAMNLTFTGDIYFSSTVIGNTITTAGKTILSSVYIDGNGGEWTLQDMLSFTTNKGIDFEAGTFNTNGQTVNFGRLWSTGVTTRILNFGASVINLQGTVATWYTTSSGLTINPGTSTINIDGEGSFNFYGGSKNYNDVNLKANVNNVRYNNVYNNLTLTSGTTVVLRSGDVQNINGFLTAIGTSSFPIEIISSSAGVISTFSSPNDVCAQYLLLSDNVATGGGVFTADNSTDVTNNTGWVFGTCTILKLEFSDSKVLDEDVNNDVRLKVYPNPTKGLLTVISNNLELLKDFQVYDIMGRNVTDKINLVNTFEGGIVLDLSNLFSGMYILKVKQSQFKVYKQ